MNSFLIYIAIFLLFFYFFLKNTFFFNLLQIYINRPVTQALAYILPKLHKPFYTFKNKEFLLQLNYYYWLFYFIILIEFYYLKLYSSLWVWVLLLSVITNTTIVSYSYSNNYNTNYSNVCEKYFTFHRLAYLVQSVSDAMILYTGVLFPSMCSILLFLLIKNKVFLFFFITFFFIIFIVINSVQFYYINYVSYFELVSRNRNTDLTVSPLYNTLLYSDYFWIHLVNFIVQLQLNNNILKDQDADIYQYLIDTGLIKFEYDIAYGYKRNQTSNSLKKKMEKLSTKSRLKNLLKVKINKNKIDVFYFIFSFFLNEIILDNFINKLEIKEEMYQLIDHLVAYQLVFIKKQLNVSPILKKILIGLVYIHMYATPGRYEYIQRNVY